MERQVTDEQREGVLRKVRTAECGERRLVVWSPQDTEALRSLLEHLRKLEG